MGLLVGGCASQPTIVMPEPLIVSGATSTWMQTDEGVDLWQPNLPIIISPEPRFAAEAGFELEVAMQFWNDRVHFQLFKFGAHGVAVDWTSDIPSDCGANKVGCCMFHYVPSGRMSQTKVLIHDALRPLEYPMTRVRVLIHELGHAAGLAHDEDKASVMYHTLTAGPADATPEDLEALIEEYEPRAEQ